MQALTPNAPSSVATSTLPPETSSLLPHPLYYLNNDSAGFLQVYRLEMNGETVEQITFEPSNVNTYDVSPVDGSVAFISNNQLLLVNVDGSNRRILVDGGPLGSDEFVYHQFSQWRRLVARWENDRFWAGWFEFLRPEQRCNQQGA